MKVRWRVGLVASSFVLVAACSTDESNSEAHEDCHMPFEFSSQMYSMVLGPEVATVEPGRLLGTGDFAPCDDGGGTGGDSRAVHALHDVPKQQAVVLLGEGDRGRIYVSDDPPPNAWDADLLKLMDAWSVQLPQPWRGRISGSFA